MPAISNIQILSPDNARKLFHVANSDNHLLRRSLLDDWKFRFVEKIIILRRRHVALDITRRCARSFPRN